MATLTQANGGANSPLLTMSIWFKLPADIVAPATINLLEVGGELTRSPDIAVGFGLGEWMLDDYQFETGNAHFREIQDRVGVAHTTGNVFDDFANLATLVSSIYAVYDPSGPFGNTLCVQLVGARDSVDVTSRYVCDFAPIRAMPEELGFPFFTTATPYVSVHYTHLSAIAPGKWLHLLVAADTSQESTCSLSEVDTAAPYSDPCINQHSGGNPDGSGFEHYDPTSPGTSDSQSVATGTTVLAFLNRRKLLPDRELGRSYCCRVGDRAAGQIQAAANSLKVVSEELGTFFKGFQAFTLDASLLGLSSGRPDVDMRLGAPFNAQWDDYTVDPGADPPATETFPIVTYAASYSVAGFDIDWVSSELGLPFQSSDAYSYNLAEVAFAGIQIWKGLFANPSDPIFGPGDILIGQVMDLFISPAGKFVKPSIAQLAFGVPAVSLNGNISESQFINTGTLGTFTYIGTITDADGPPTA